MIDTCEIIKILAINEFASILKIHINEELKWKFLVFCPNISETFGYILEISLKSIKNIKIIF